MFNKEILKNRFHNGCLAAAGTAPIIGLAAYKVLDDLRLERDMFKIVKFTIVVALVSGLIWSLFPSSRKKPSDVDEDAVKDSFSPKFLIAISEQVQNAEDEYLTDMHRKRRIKEGKERKYEKDENDWDWRKSNSESSGYDRYRAGMSSESRTLSEESSSNPLRTGGPFNRSTITQSKSSELAGMEVRKVLMADE